MTRLAVLITLVAAVGAMLGLAPAAAAQGIPGVDVCPTEAPPVERPGDGVIVGNIDTTPPGRGADGTVYNEYGYAGLTWHTYDLGCYHPGPSFHNTIGNLLFDAAKTIVAAYMWLHYTVQDAYQWDWLQNIIGAVAERVYGAVYLQLLTLALLVLLVAMSRHLVTGNMAKLTQRSAWALAAMATAAATALSGIALFTFAGGTLTNVIATAEAGMYRGSGIDPVDAVPTTIHREVVYEPWLEGEFGSAEAPQAEEYGRQLLAAQACTKAEVRDGSCDDTAEENQSIGEEAADALGDFFSGVPSPAEEALPDTKLQKQADFEELVTEENMGPAYPFLTGAAEHRAGAGLWALGAAVAFVLFPAAALLALLVALLLLAALIMAGPLIGLVSVVRHKMLHAAFTAALSAMVSALVLAVLAGVHAALLLLIVNDSGLPPAMQLVVMLVFSALLWAAVRPFKLMWSMVKEVRKVFTDHAVEREKTKVGRHHVEGRDSKRWWHGSGARGRDDEPAPGARPETVRATATRTDTPEHAGVRRALAGAAAGRAVNGAAVASGVGAAAGSAAGAVVARRVGGDRQREDRASDGQRADLDGPVYEHVPKDLDGRPWIGPGQQPHRREIGPGQPPAEPNPEGEQREQPRTTGTPPAAPQQQIFFGADDGPQEPARHSVDQDMRIYDVTSGTVIDPSSRSDDEEG